MKISSVNPFFSKISKPSLFLSLFSVILFLLGYLFSKESGGLFFLVGAFPLFLLALEGALFNFIPVFFTCLGLIVLSGQQLFDLMCFSLNLLLPGFLMACYKNFFSGKKWVEKSGLTPFHFLMVASLLSMIVLSVLWPRSYQDPVILSVLGAAMVDFLPGLISIFFLFLHGLVFLCFQHRFFPLNTFRFQTTVWDYFLLALCQARLMLPFLRDDFSKNLLVASLAPFLLEGTIKFYKKLYHYKWPKIFIFFMGFTFAGVVMFGAILSSLFSPWIEKIFSKKTIIRRKNNGND